MRHVLLAAAVLVTCCHISAQSDQAPSPSALDERRRLLRVMTTLVEVGRRLPQHSQDIIDMARPLTGTCEPYHVLMDVTAQGNEADATISGVFGLLDMYMSLSMSTDQTAAAKVLTRRGAEAKDSLQHQVKGLNTLLSSPSMPPGAAVTTTQIRDDVRMAVEALDQLKP
jgi:hypothetical protein